MQSMPPTLGTKTDSATQQLLHEACHHRQSRRRTGQPRCQRRSQGPPQMLREARHHPLSWRRTKQLQRKTASPATSPVRNTPPSAVLTTDWANAGKKPQSCARRASTQEAVRGMPPSVGPTTDSATEARVAPTNTTTVAARRAPPSAELTTDVATAGHAPRHSAQRARTGKLTTGTVHEEQELLRPRLHRRTVLGHRRAQVNGSFPTLVS